MAGLTSEAIWCRKHAARNIYGDWPDCPYCGAPFYWLDGEADHIVPIIAGGSNSEDNTALVCGDCNHKKAGKRPREWLLEMGYSLNDCRSLLQEQAKRVEWLN